MGNHSGPQDLNRPMDLSGTKGFGMAFVVIFVVGMVLFGVTFWMLIAESSDVPVLKQQQAEKAAAEKAAAEKAGAAKK